MRVYSERGQGKGKLSLLPYLTIYLPCGILIGEEVGKMTITMTAKNQVTIPQEIVTAMGLEKGSLFSVEIRRNRIELVPLEPTEKVFTDKEYEALERLCQEEKGKAKKVTKKFIDELKKGNV